MSDIRAARLDNVEYLTQEKSSLIDSCAKCKGLDLLCDCYRLYDLEVRKVRANIPLKYRKANMSALRSKEVAKPKETIRMYTDKISTYRKRGTGMYLWGPPGTAKTYSGCCVLIAALESGYSAYFTTLDNCIDRILGDRSTSAGFVTLLQTVSFLLLDDIGYAYRPVKDQIAFVDSLLDRIMRQRCNDLLPTIVTSHKSVGDVEEANCSGSRIASIVKEHMKRVQFSGPDYRGTIGAGS